MELHEDFITLASGWEDRLRTAIIALNQPQQLTLRLDWMEAQQTYPPRVIAWALPCILAATEVAPGQSSRAVEVLLSNLGEPPLSLGLFELADLLPVLLGLHDHNRKRERQARRAARRANDTKGWLLTWALLTEEE